jgi:glyoxylase-like metal-dependent hydrolase (beta-lactamase superfamily II)
MRERGVRYYAANGDARSAAALGIATAVVPTEVLEDRVVVDLGGRNVNLSHLGRGHTDNDVVVDVKDAAVVFAGDLVEQGAPPVIGADAYPAEWPSTLDHLLSLDPAVVVPGHGEPVGASFVRTQRDELHVVAELVRAVSAGELTEDEAARRSPYPKDVTLSALSHAQPTRSDQPTMP